MRLIDADVLDRGLKNFLALMPDEKHPEAHMAFEMILERMERIPTISPESLRAKGRWVEKDFGEAYECSNCGWLNDFRLSCYCPSCGAKMEG